MINVTRISFLRLLPYLGIWSLNPLIEIIYRNNRTQYLSWQLLLLSCLVYFASTYLVNIYNRIVALGWILFYFLGILNINSVLKNTNAWSLKIEQGSYLYLWCVFIFIVSMAVFERYVVKPPVPTDSKVKKARFTIFNVVLLVFPFMFIFSMYRSLGFLPLFSAENFAAELYDYNYGPLYGLKFLCIYGILYAIILSSKKGLKYFGLLYATLLLVILAVDGKRFVMLLSLISAIPVYSFIRERVNARPPSKRPLIAAALIIVSFYTVISYVRSPASLNGIVAHTIEKIPFGVEFKDYIHSFNSISRYTVRDYDLGVSSIGAFMNSDVLAFLGYNKDEMTSKGSAYVWKRVYDEGVGIRTGIISELYFAYGYFALLFMIPLGYLTTLVTQKLKQPLSYFNLIQYSILYGLIFLLINGQATVFFGCLTLMLYMLIMYKFINFFFRLKIGK